MVFCNTLSPSKASTYLQCKLKYKRRYIERMDPDPDADIGAMQFGSFIHKILEDGVEAESVNQLQRLSEDNRSSYKFSDRKYTQAKIDKCLNNFFEFNASLSETVGTETRFKVDIAEDMTLNGVIDRVLKSPNGDYLVIDYKTSRKELDKFGLYNSDQMKAYAYAIHKLKKVPFDKIIVGHYYPLTNNFVYIKFKKQDINRFVTEQINLMWDIRKRKKENFFPELNQFCKWCEYKKSCPDFKG